MNVTTDSIKNFRTILIHGLPRQGKTRWSISILAESRSGIYLTHRHEIINHALKIFRSLTDKKTCVWLEGKARSCRTGTMNCESCLMKPDNTKEENISYFKLEAIVEDLLDRYKVLTKERITEAENLKSMIYNLMSMCEVNTTPTFGKDRYRPPRFSLPWKSVNEDCTKVFYTISCNIHIEHRWVVEILPFPPLFSFIRVLQNC